MQNACPKPLGFILCITPGLEQPPLHFVDVSDRSGATLVSPERALEVGSG